MKLELLQENLNKGLSVVSRVLVTKPQIPILSNVLLKAGDGQLEITASNMETTITTIIGAKTEISGAYTVPGKTLVEIVAGISTDKKITLSLENGSLVVSSGKFKAKINGVPENDFPKIPEFKNKTSWTFESKLFKDVINKTIFSCATDEGRAVLTGVLFKTTNDTTVLAATDGFRLSTVKIPSKTPLDEGTFIIPSKALFETTRLLVEKTISLVYSQEFNQIMFDLGDTKIYSRLIAGNFPDFEKIIPSTSTIKIVVSTDELLKTIKLASIFARDSANIVKFNIGTGKLKISANSPQIGEDENEVEIRIEKGESEEISIAFNYRYFVDLLSNIVSDEVVCEFNGPLASGVFKIPSDPNFLHIIMPVRVQG